MRLFLLLVLFMVVSTLSAGELKVALVDMQQLFKQYPGTPVAQKKFQTLTEQKRKDLADSEESMEELQKQLSNPSKLTSEVRQAKMDQLQQQSQDLQTQKTDIQNQLADKEQEMTQALLGQIKTIVAKVAQGEGYDLVLNSSDVASAPQGVDLTADVLKKFSTVKIQTDSTDTN